MTAQVRLSVLKWSAWAPGIYGEEAWCRWASGDGEIGGDAAPDVSFVPPMLRRRLSRETKLAFRVANDCLEGADRAPGYIFCSRYGEFTRTFELLGLLADEEPLSASAFSMSVHNTAASLFSINRGDRVVSSSLAAGESTLETSFVEAWSQLSAEQAETVLIVYFDAPLPDDYRQRDGALQHPLAVAMLLELSNYDRGAPILSLKWKTQGEGVVVDGGLGGGALDVVRLLAKPGPPIATVQGRMTWEWGCEPASTRGKS